MVEASRRTRLLLRLHGAVSTVLVLAAVALLGWLSHTYSVQFDWTSGGRNTLSAVSERVLDAIDGPIRVTAFAREDEVLRGAVRALIDRYRRRKADIALDFVNPDRMPERTRRLGITTDGELVLEHAGRSEHVTTLSEGAVTSAIDRLGQTRELWIVYLTGHGERDLLGRANHDLGTFGDHLASRGFKVQPLNLSEAGEVPEATGILVITRGSVDFLSGEVEAIRGYLARGGNALWLADPGPLQGLAPVATDLGLTVHPGTVVDPTGRMFGIDQADFVVVTRYGPHPATTGLDLVSVFPRAAALEATGEWKSTPLVSSARSSWVETGSRPGEPRFDEGADLRGPVDIALALSRPHPAGDGAERSEQLVAVVGDGDFLANSYVGNGGNLDIGVRLIRWLARQDRMIDIPVRAAPDARIELTEAEGAALGLGTLIGVPGLLLAIGAGVWVRRRRH